MYRILFLLFAVTLSYAQTASLANAQKAYLSANWAEAAKLFNTVCPQLEKEKQPECVLWTILSLSQTGRMEDFSSATKKLDSLIQASSPQNPIYTDLYMTKAQFELYLNKFDLSVISLRHAIETSRPSQYPVLLKVCSAIEKAYRKPEVQELCLKLQSNPEKVSSLSSSSIASSSSIETQTSPSSIATQISSSSIVTLSLSSSSVFSSSVATPSAIFHKKEWILQLGAFSQRENALLLADNLNKRKILTQIKEKIISEKTLYLVHSESFETESEAIEYGKKIFTPLNIEFRALKWE